MVESVVRVKKAAVNRARRLVMVILMVLNVDGHVAHDAVRHASWGGHGVITRVVLVCSLLRVHVVGSDNAVLLRLSYLVIEALIGKSVVRWDSPENSVLVELNRSDIVSVVELVVKLTVRQVIETVVRVEETAVNVTGRLVVVILVILNVDRHVAHDAVRHASWGGHGVITRVVLVCGLLRMHVVGSDNAVLLWLSCLVIEALVGKSIMRWDSPENSVLVELNWSDVMGVIKLVVEFTVRQMVESVVMVEEAAINMTGRLMVVVLVVLNIHGHVAHDWVRNGSWGCHGMVTGVVLVSSLFGTNMVGSHNAVLLGLDSLIIEALVRESIVRWDSPENSVLVELNWSDVMGIIKLVV